MGLIIGVIWVGLSCFTTTLSPYVSPGNTGTAHVLLQTIDGETPRLNPLRGSRMSGYPLVLTGLALVTPGTKAGLACWGERRQGCTMSMLFFVLAVQYLAALAVLAMAFRIACNLSGRIEIGVVAVVLTFFSTRPGELAGRIAPGIWDVFFLSLYLFALTESYNRRSWRFALLSGCALGMAVLFQPAAALLIPLSAMQLLVASWRSQKVQPPSFPILASGLFLMAAVFFVAAPLLLLAALSYDAAPMLRYFAVGVSQRMAFIDLDQSTWLAAVIAPVPLFGDLLLALVPEQLAQKVGTSVGRANLIATGADLLFPDAYARSGQSGAASAVLLLREGLIERPLAYLISIPPVVARGLFGGGGIIAFLGLFHLRRAMRFARAENRMSLHLLVFVPIIALFVLNVLTTHNSYWLNPMLPFAYAYAIAYVSGGW